MERTSVAKVLRKVPLFSSLRPNDVQRLAELASTRSYRAGSTIVKQDDTAITLYCVLSGRVRIERESARGDGRLVLAEMGEGGFFGEMALLDDFPRSASAIAETATECALLSKWDFQREIKSHPEIARTLLRVLSQRIRALDERLVAL